MIAINGDKIKQLRKEKGWSQTKVAQKMGVSKSYVSKLENSNRRGSLDIVTKLSEIYKVDIEQILKTEKNVGWI